MADQIYSKHNTFRNQMVDRIPIIFWLILVYMTTLVLHFIETGSVLPVIAFTILMILHGLMYWYSYHFQSRLDWLYILLQSMIIMSAAFLVPYGSHVILIGLLPILIAQCISIFQNSLKIIIIIFSLYLLYCLAITINYGLEVLPLFIPIFFFVLAIVIFYSMIYTKQIKARLRMESYLEELKHAHQKVEELTVANERKRMARDLHDTLAQGLAGVVMKLEATELYLQSEDIDRSKEIIQVSKQQARETLQKARNAIDNLRLQSGDEYNLTHEVKEKVEAFTRTTNIKVFCAIEPIPPLPELVKQHMMHVISESLSNIEKHAQASDVELVIKSADKCLVFEISDNGIGFDTKIIDEKSGHYGLIGLYERVQILNGRIQVVSKLGEGTNIKVQVPIEWSVIHGI